MLTPAVIAIVKATAPVLAEHGLAIVELFYRRLFEAHPHLKHMFDLRRQETAAQQRALAATLLACASNIDHLSTLEDAIRRIAHKHASLNVRPEQYMVIGHKLLGAVKEYLGDAATDEVLAAWSEAYGRLAGEFIGAEADLYAEAALKPGGWTGWRDFVVRRKRRDGDAVTSFFLTPKDGGAVAGFAPGQYVSVLVDVPALGLQQTRQYGLSEAPGGRTYRIAVGRGGRGDGEGGSPVSGLLHDHVDEGDTVRLSPPFGDSRLDPRAAQPAAAAPGASPAR